MSYLSGAFIIIGILFLLYVASVIEAIGFVHGLRLLARLSRNPGNETSPLGQQDGGSK